MEILTPNRVRHKLKRRGDMLWTIDWIDMQIGDVTHAEGRNNSRPDKKKNQDSLSSLQNESSEADL